MVSSKTKNPGLLKIRAQTSQKPRARPVVGPEEPDELWPSPISLCVKAPIVALQRKQDSDTQRLNMKLGSHTSAPEEDCRLLRV